jgi:hypothetical protein
MINKRRFEEDSETEEYLHKAAWQVVKRQIESAESNPNGALYDDLVTMVFAYHSFEGYLNFVGEKIAPDLWKEEKERFKDRLPEKLREICSRCEISIWEEGKRPYSTLTELKKLRDKMAHPKTHRARQKVGFVENKPPPLFPKSYLASLVNHKKALRARDDVKRVADEIHSAAVRRFPHAGLGPDALCGIQSMRTASTRLL